MTDQEPPLTKVDLNHFRNEIVLYLAAIIIGAAVGAYFGFNS